MSIATLSIIRFALAVQFICVLIVPALIASQEAPRGMWMAEWTNPVRESLLGETSSQSDRAFGVLRLKGDVLTFAEQRGQANWELSLTDVRRIELTTGANGIRIVLNSGKEYVLGILAPNLTPQSPKRVIAALEQALKTQATARQ